MLCSAPALENVDGHPVLFRGHVEPFEKRSTRKTPKARHRRRETCLTKSPRGPFLFGGTNLLRRCLYTRTLTVRLYTMWFLRALCFSRVTLDRSRLPTLTPSNETATPVSPSKWLLLQDTSRIGDIQFPCFASEMLKIASESDAQHNLQKSGAIQ